MINVERCHPGVMADDQLDEQEFLRRAAADRLHVLDGMATAIERRDELIQIVSGSADIDDAHRRLRDTFGFTDVQATAALDLQVRRFSTTSRERIQDERADMRRHVHPSA